MPVKIFFIILAIVGIASAETRIYLIKRAEHFQQDRFLYNPNPTEYKYFIDTGNKNINDAGGQPFKMTTYQISPNGKYAVLSITPKDNNEKTKYLDMEKNGYIVLLSTIDVTTTYDERTGGSILTMGTHQLTGLPTDYYQVDISTE